jgi:predicted RNA-binding protein with PIN domain
MVTDAPSRLIVDGNNVMGARPDGWWRDRAGAARRLLARVQCYAATINSTVELVFDVALPDVPEGDHGGVTVRYATSSGRDAADDRIRELLDSRGRPEGRGSVEVVTSDRALAASARASGASIAGAGTFLARMEQAGC